jgi:hypothetical protein
LVCKQTTSMHTKKDLCGRMIVEQIGTLRTNRSQLTLQEVNDIYKKDCIPNNRQSHLRRFLQMYTNELSVILYRFDCMLDKFGYRISIFTDYVHRGP